MTTDIRDLAYVLAHGTPTEKIGALILDAGHSGTFALAPTPIRDGTPGEKDAWLSALVTAANAIRGAENGSDRACNEALDFAVAARRARLAREEATA